MRRRNLRAAVAVGIVSALSAMVVATCVLVVVVVAGPEKTGLETAQLLPYCLPALAAGLLAALLTGIPVALALTASNSDPIKPLIEASRQIAAGNYAYRVEPTAGDEVGELCQAFNRMSDKITFTVEQLGRQNDWMETVMAAMDNALIAVNIDLRVILVNDAAQSLLGIGADALDQKVSDAIVSVRLERLLSDAVRLRRTQTLELPIYANGERTVRLTVSPMWRDKQVAGALAMMTDITELRRLEQMRSEFVANVSHELKTPLTSIKGFVETLIMDENRSPETVTRFLRIIDIETNRLTRLIEDILSLSELEKDVRTGRDEVLRLEILAEDTVELLRPQAQEKRIDLAIEMPPQPLYVRGDEDRVKQLVMNLVDNAIKYTPEGGSVRVLLERDGTWNRLTVADTGIGIAPEHQKRLFERFYRVDKGRSRQMGGTGLGLAIVKHIVFTMKGTVRVESAPNAGSRFIIEIPAEGVLEDGLD